MQLSTAIGTLALLLTYTAPNTLVRLSLISYEGMAQLVPMLLPRLKATLKRWEASEGSY